MRQRQVMKAPEMTSATTKTWNMAPSPAQEAMTRRTACTERAKTTKTSMKTAAMSKTTTQRTISGYKDKS